MGKFKFILLSLLVVFLGVGVGYWGGTKIASKHFSINLYESINEEDLYDDVNLINYSNRTPDTLSATEVFVVANYLYENKNIYTNVCTGQIIASVGITQDSYQLSYKNGDYFKSEVATVGSFMSTAKRYEYTKGGNIVFTIGKVNTNDIKNFTWTNDVQEMSLNEFIDQTGSAPDCNCSYIVSSKTVINESTCLVENGIYTYTLTLDTLKAPLNYAKQIAYSSKINDLPVFSSLTLTFSVDKDYNLINSHKVEKYKINYSGIKVDIEAFFDTTY